MLATRLTRADALAALAQAGHNALVAVVDAHFPATTATGPNASRVYLNVERGVPTADRVLELVLDLVAVEAAAVMDVGYRPAHYDDFDRLLAPLTPEPIEPQTFYERTRSPDTALVLVTGDERGAANVLLRIGLTDLRA